MQAQQERHINAGHEFNGYFPQANRKDIVIEHQAGLDDTISLMLRIVPETKKDTQKIATLLKRKTLKQTCKAIWEFVYGHIQYKKDKAGVEQVRRPARSWADRKQGVDCDCYTVFISSILMNLGIPHHIRITKYNGRPNFQHVYPVVPTPKGHITMDCVTDQFNYEVPFSGHQDFEMKQPLPQISGLSGLDHLAIQEQELAALVQPRLSLRPNHQKPCDFNIHIHHKHTHSKPHGFHKKANQLKRSRITPKRESSKKAVVAPSFQKSMQPKLFKAHQAAKNTMPTTDSEALIKTILVVGVGYGAYRLFGSTPSKKKRKKQTSITKRTTKRTTKK